MPFALDIETFETPIHPSVADFLRTRHEGEIDKLALSPLTGCVIAVSVADTRPKQPVRVFTWGVPTRLTVRPGIELDTFASEKEMLQEVWDLLTVLVDGKKPIVTFNGRSFDVPFLAVRAAVNGVAADPRLIREVRQGPAHIDLRDVVNAYGSARFPHDFNVLCHALGVPSPKEDGFDGSKVGPAWSAGEHQRVLEYAADDAESLAACYRVLGPSLGLLEEVPPPWKR